MTGHPQTLDRQRLWGVAVSHYQVEGNDACDWSAWEEVGRARGGACGEAVDSWRLYEQDALLAAEAGANAFRFSISWSRIEPRRGEFDPAALARYRRFLDHLRSLDLEPVVTLFHYTHPVWFHQQSPWTSTRSVDAFARFASSVATALGDSVTLFTIFNEPLVFLLAGFIDGQIPPGISDPGEARKALSNIFAAHVEARAAILEINPAAQIGLAHNMMAFAPDRRWNPLDQALAAASHRFYNLSFLEAFRTGRWNLILPPGSLFRGSQPALRDSLDFVGVNFYSRLHMRFPGKQRGFGDFRYVDRSGKGLTDNGWEIVPDDFERMLREAAGFGFPLMVTENGLADADDTRRSLFLRQHLDAIERVESDGIPIHGYFHWSLLDNFEWLDGYSPRFGLYEVDRTTMTRRARRSVETFRELGARFLQGNVHSARQPL